MFGVTDVYTLMNTLWDKWDQPLTLRLNSIGADDAYLNVDLSGNVHIRDYLQHIWTNQINGTTTVPAFLGTAVSGPFAGQEVRLDRQLLLPQSSWIIRLDRIVFTDRGGNDFQRLLLNGITVATARSTGASASVEILVEDGRGIARQCMKSASNPMQAINAR